MGAGSIFSGAANSGMHFFPQKLTNFLVVTLKTQVFTVTTNAQNTLEHFQGQVPPALSFPFILGLLVLDISIAVLC